MAFPVSSKPVSLPTQSSVNTHNGNLEKAVEGDSAIQGDKGGGRGGMSGDLGNMQTGDVFEQAKQTGGATGVVLNQDDLFA